MKSHMRTQIEWQTSQIMMKIDKWKNHVAATPHVPHKLCDQVTQEVPKILSVGMYNMSNKHFTQRFTGKQSFPVVTGLITSHIIAPSQHLQTQPFPPPQHLAPLPSIIIQQWEADQVEMSTHSWCDEGTSTWWSTQGSKLWQTKHDIAWPASSDWHMASFWK